MRRHILCAISAIGAIGAVFLLGAITGCATPTDSGNRESGITMYGTVDAGVSVTRDR
nr:hypothetical protein [uncultured Cupriavidus sp.]